MAIPGGSAYAFARDVGEGYQLVTERTFKSFSRGDMDTVALEFERALREARADNTPTSEVAEVQARNRKIQRLNAALIVLRNAKQRLAR